jgi:protein SCO1/2
VTAPRNQSGRAAPTRGSPRLQALVVATVLIASIATGCGGTGSSSNPTGSTSASGFAGTALTPVHSAPPLALRNYLGDAVSLDNYRGKAVLVTFLYTHCVDVCPVVTANLRLVLQQLGPAARRVQVIAVSVDPRGDTRKTVAAFLRAHNMTGRMKYLIGTASQLQPVWKAWHVAAVRDPTSRKLVTHTSVTYGVSTTGKLMTLYGPSFQPAQIAHDVPKLITG